MLQELSKIKPAKSRSISPENFTGAEGNGGSALTGTGAGCARELGVGFKVSPSIEVKPAETFVLGEIEGPGCIQSIWLTTTYIGKNFILRIYWDDQTIPSVECPVSDFFGCGWTDMEASFPTPTPRLNSALIAVNPNNGLNCYFPMPFQKKCRMTLENRTLETKTVYYQINYELREVLPSEGYFHAQHRHTPIVPHADVHTILDGVCGEGQYIGTMMFIGLNGANG